MDRIDNSKIDYLSKLLQELITELDQLSNDNTTAATASDSFVPGDESSALRSQVQQLTDVITDLQNNNSELKCHVEGQQNTIADLRQNNSELAGQVRQQCEMLLELRRQLTLSEIHRMNLQTLLSERQQLHNPQVEQEATTEMSCRTELEICEYDTVVLNERSPTVDSDQVEQRRGIESEQLHTEAFDDVEIELRGESVGPSDYHMPLFEDDNINQSDGSLRVTQACSVRIRKVGGKRTTFDLRSPEASAENPRNSRQGSKKHSCGECNKQFKFKSHLTQHKRIHTGEKPFKCEECNAAFSQRGSLKSHQRIHSGEKPFKCEECTAAFIHAGNLKSHQRIHSDEKPFMCDICKKSFRQKIALSVHMRTHFGGKSHKCNVCEKEFRHKSTLKKHLKIHSK